MIRESNSRDLKIGDLFKIVSLNPGIESDGQRRYIEHTSLVFLGYRQCDDDVLWIKKWADKTLICFWTESTIIQSLARHVTAGLPAFYKEWPINFMDDYWKIVVVERMI